MPTSVLNSIGFICLISFPSYDIKPVILHSSIKSFILSKHLNNVDLPHPEGPINAVTLFL